MEDLTIVRLILRYPLEAVVWLIGLLSLAMMDPGVDHISMCPLKSLGIEYCPGCGLGRSVSFLLRGQFAESFAAHPLGIFAVIILTYRIFHLTKDYLKLYGKSN
jgi:hypothetical protein